MCGQCIDKEEDEKSVTWYLYFFAQEGERISAGRCSGLSTVHCNRDRAIELAVDGISAETRHTTSGDYMPNYSIHRASLLHIPFTI